MSPKFDNIEQLLEAQSAPSQRLVQAARKHIRAVVPTAVERFRPGWGLIGYNAPAYFAFILVDGKGVRIGFEWGVLLSDPASRLVGDGKQVRYLPLPSVAELRHPAVEQLLCEAAQLKLQARKRRL